MSVDDSKAGKVGKCLQCNQKFRVPDNIPSEAERAPRPPVSSRPNRDSGYRSLEERLQAANQREEAPAFHDDDPASQSGYGFAAGHAPPPVKKVPPPDLDEVPEVEVDEEDDDDWDDQPARPRRKRPKKRSSSGGGRLESVLIGLGIAGGVWVLLVAITIFARDAMYGLLIIGGILLLLSRGMFLQVARAEGSGPWLMCLFVPFYSVYFFFTRINETFKSFVIGCVGWFFVLSFGVFWVFFEARDRMAEIRNLPPQVPHISMLTLDVDGKKMILELDTFRYFTGKFTRDKAPLFVLQGQGIELYGKFRQGFDRDWEELINKPVAIAPEDPASRADSHISLPRKGDFKVAKGKLTIIEMSDSDEDDPFLTGDIDLELVSKDQKQPLKVKGTFQVQVLSMP
jgi:hypothetical protein